MDGTEPRQRHWRDWGSCVCNTRGQRDLALVINKGKGLRRGSREVMMVLGFLAELHPTCPLAFHMKWAHFSVKKLVGNI